jgi:hypothetical protein
MATDDPRYLSRSRNELRVVAIAAPRRVAPVVFVRVLAVRFAIVVSIGRTVDRAIAFDRTTGLVVRATIPECEGEGVTARGELT